MRKQLLVENIIKNIIILAILFYKYPIIKEYFDASTLPTDGNLTGDLTVVVSILIVTACFGTFAFTYEKIKKKSPFSRMIGHLTTGLLMLVIGISLEMVSILAGYMIGDFQIMNFTLLSLYIATIGYDFWDLERAV